MKTQQVHDADGLRVYVAVFDKGDEAVDGLTRLAADERLDSASLTAIGAFSAATVGYFDRQTSSYLEIPVDEQVEVLSLTGDIALADGEPKLHTHVVLGRRDASTCGGHLIEGRVWPTLEVVVTETPGHLRRRTDPATGLALIELDER